MRSRPSYAAFLIALALLSINATCGGTQSPNPGSPQEQVPQPQPSETNAQQQKGEAAHPSTAKVPTASAQKISPQQEQHQTNCYLQTAGRWIVSHWTVNYTIAVVTSVYSFFAILQWYALKDTVDEARQAAKDSREALRLEQRPWLVPTGEAQLGMPNGEIQDGPMLPMRFDLKNGGNTPALQITIRWVYEVKLWDEPMPEDEVSSAHTD